MASDKSWQKIFDDCAMQKHDFSTSPFILTGAQIKRSCQNFKKTAEKEVRILCKQDSREDRPAVFRKNNLFILPIKNGTYAIVEGEGYVDIPEIKSKPKIYQSKLGFPLDTSQVGDSEMQHLDYAYAASLIRTFMQDDSFVLTIRGRKYTPEFSFSVGAHSQTLDVRSVQTEVDAGYESKDKVLLVEAKNSGESNVIIRQMYYPFRQWQSFTKKPVHLLFFEKRGDEYCVWRFAFDEVNRYDSVRIVDSARFQIRGN